MLNIELDIDVYYLDGSENVKISSNFIVFSTAISIHLYSGNNIFMLNKDGIMNILSTIDIHGAYLLQINFQLN